MSGVFDVTARLAEGWPAVRAAQTYVDACAALGHPHATRRDRVSEWYRSEDGMDLAALEHDSAALARAAAAAAEALAVQDTALAALGAGWSGAGAQSAADLLRRHADACAATVAALHTAAEVLAALRTDLWQLVDRKVAATAGIDGGRGDWQAAAHTVLTGAGDRSVASEVVDGEVEPFVSEVVECDWMALMRRTLASIEEKFDAAIAALTDPGPGFPDERSSAAAGPEPATAHPAAVPAYPPAAPVAAGPAAEPEGPAPVPPPAAAAPMPAPSPAGWSGLPDIGTGLSGAGRQFIDLLAGLLGSATDAFGTSFDNGFDTADIDDPAEPDQDSGDRDSGAQDTGGEDADEDRVEETEDTDESQGGAVDETEGADAENEAADAENEADKDNTDGEAGGEPADGDGQTPADTGADPVAAAENDAAAPPVMPPPSAQTPAAPAESATPCEIAANELPQVGE